MPFTNGYTLYFFLEERKLRLTAKIICDEYLKGSKSEDTVLQALKGVGISV
jgi:hypothetical protein